MSPAQRPLKRRRHSPDMAAGDIEDGAGDEAKSQGALGLSFTSPKIPQAPTIRTRTRSKHEKSATTISESIKSQETPQEDDGAEDERIRQWALEAEHGPCANEVRRLLSLPEAFYTSLLAKFVTPTSPEQSGSQKDRGSSHSSALSLHINTQPKRPPAFLPEGIRLETALVSELKNQKDKDTLLNLVKVTSKQDYERSIIGWHQAQKRKELSMPGMRALILRSNLSNSSSSVFSTSEPAATKNGGHDKDEKNKKALNEENGEIVAFATLLPTTTNSTENPNLPAAQTHATVLYMYEIHVSPSHQGHGLGSFLLQTIIIDTLGAALKSNTDGAGYGVSRVMLTVFERNERAKRMYEKLGCRTVWVEDDDRMRGDGKGGYRVMELVL